MTNLETLKQAIEDNVPGARVEILANPSVSAQHSLLLTADSAFAVALFLRDTLGYDYCSNVTGVDWPYKEVSEKVKIKQVVDGEEKDVDQVRITKSGGYLEVVYHLYSMSQRLGPVILRLRTQDRDANTHLPSLTPIWRSCDFQEREVFDLYGVLFDGHPDLRRILMWDEFTDFPMRRDYVEPDDYEYEPTAHDEVLQKFQQHHGIEP